MDTQELVLPIEILEHILSFLDLSSMVRASRVNSIWRSAYLNIAKQQWLLEKCCRNEIGPDGLVNIIDKLYPGYLGFSNIDAAGVDWFRIYKCFHFLKKFERIRTSQKTLIEEFGNAITCVNSTADILLYGTANEGNLYAYNMQTQVRQSLYRGHGVLDIDTSPSHSNISSLTLNSAFNYHTGITLFLSNNRVLPLSISFMEKFEVGKSTFEAYAHCNFLDWPLAVKRNYYLKLKSLGYTSAVLDMKTALVDRFFVTVNTVGEVKLVDCRDVQSLSARDIRFSGWETITRWRQLNYNVSLGIAYEVYHMMFFIVGGKVKAYVPTPEMYSIRAALIHCNVLFLGNSQGAVFAYRLKNYESLLSLTLSDFIWKCRLVPGSITSIDIQYTHANIPFFIISTGSSIHKIVFKI